MPKKKSAKEIHTFTIVRSKWIRSHHRIVGRKSALLTDDGKPPLMCCLGFYLKSLGIPKSLLRGNGTPGTCLSPKVPAWLRTNSPLHSVDAAKLMHLNDKPLKAFGFKTYKERENAIREMFATHNVRVRFVD